MGPCSEGPPRKRTAADAEVGTEAPPAPLCSYKSIHARWVAPVESGMSDVLEDHVVCIEDGRITAIMPRQDFAGEPDLHLPTHILIPGLVNAHTHTPMTLLRGYADDLPLNEWLFNHIFPTEGKFILQAPVDEAKEFVRCGSELACYEMLKSGTTLFNDMYFFGDITADVAREAGMKAVLTEVGLLYFGDDKAFAEAVTKNTDFCSGLVEAKDAQIYPSLLPHSVYMCPAEKLKEAKAAYDKACGEAKVIVHTHLHETKKEISDVLEKTGQSAVNILDSLGLLTDRTVAAHCVHMSDDEIKLMAARGANVAHCPRSNLKLGSGIAPVAQMLATGVNVCLGTDGASSNNTLDMLTEMQYASMIAKGSTGDPTVLSARATLEMATIRGARALGLEHETGSIKVGKAADLAAVNLDHLEASPIFDALGHLVFTNSREVTHVWVNGRCLVDGGRVLSVSVDRAKMDRIVDRVREFRATLSGKSQ
eukprot:gb/GFBE01021299.1/.p1 GENE.gb/GFBE01021299.1/~~gb/GFBE01021299.1/.p1  ORF type:complete len:480 (+),score=78.65 gb/GFBE01021299.1/:1-1440(+)